MIPTFGLLRLAQTGDTRQIPFIYYSINLVNNVFWTLYGIQKHIWPIWIANSTGIIVYPIFLSLYIFFHYNLNAYKKVAYILSLYGLLNAIVFLSYYFIPVNIKGIISTFLGVITQFSLVITISQVCETGNSIYVDIYLMVSKTFLNGLYFCYGFLLKNHYIMITNSLGFTLNILLIGLYIFVRRDDSLNIEELTTDTSNKNEILTSKE